MLRNVSIGLINNLLELRDYVVFSMLSAKLKSYRIRFCHPLICANECYSYRESHGLWFTNPLENDQHCTFMMTQSMMVVVL